MWDHWQHSLGPTQVSLEVFTNYYVLLCGTASLDNNFFLAGNSSFWELSDNETGMAAPDGKIFTSTVSECLFIKQSHFASFVVQWNVTSS